MVHVQQQTLNYLVTNMLMVTLTSISYGVRKRHGRRLGRASFPITPPATPLISSVKKLKSRQGFRARHILESQGGEREREEKPQEGRKRGIGKPGGKRPAGTNLQM